MFRQNTIDAQGNTAFHQICLAIPHILTEEEAAIECCQRICANPTIDINRKNNENKSALSIAIEKNAVSLINMLLVFEKVTLGSTNEEKTLTLNAIKNLTPRQGDDNETVRHNQTLSHCKLLAEEKILPRIHRSHLFYTNQSNAPQTPTPPALKQTK